MFYTVKERLYRAYQNVVDLYKDMRYRIKNPRELLIIAESGDAVHISGHGIAVDWFIDHIEGLGQGAVRVTPQNFHILNPRQSVQLLLDLEGRLGTRKENPSNTPT